MPKITEIDKNFAKRTDSDGLYYFDPMTSNVRISGLPWLSTNRNYHRMDDRLYEKFSYGVRALSANTAGVQDSFKTDSRRLGVRVTVEENNLLPHMAQIASTGIDVYVGAGRRKEFRTVFFPYMEGDRYGSVRELETDGAEEITLNLPLYCGVKSLEIGVDSDSVIEPPEPYDYEMPVLFYGSSITQGACASRPGNSYCSALGRRFNFEVINLGFSGSCKGETLIAEQIAALDLAAFVYDYDHNADTATQLRETHKPFFDIIRKAHPELPVIMISKADMTGGYEFTRAKRDVVKETYDISVANGDRKVWFVDGLTMYGEDAGDCTVDGCHPNDLGFRRMADAIAPALREALGEDRERG